MPSSFTTTFDYDGTHTLMVSVYHSYSWGTSRHTFGVYINNYFQGYIARDEAGFWGNLDKTPIHEQSPKRVPPPFELEAMDWQVIGEIIEERLGEWV